MKIQSLYFTVLLLTGNLFAELTFDLPVDSIMVPLMNQRYNQARTFLNTILQSDPDNLDALYMHLNINATELLDYESYPIHGNTYLHFADSILKIIENRGKNVTGKRATRYLFYKANIFG